MFLKSGVKAVTMDDVASRLGVSKRTIYENFGDKLQLLKACMEYRNCAKQKEIDEYNQLSMVELLYRVLTGISTNIVEQNHEYRMFQEIKKYYPALYNEMGLEMHKKSLEYMVERIERGKRDGVCLEQVDTTIAANMFVSQMDTFIHSDSFATISDVAGFMRHVCIIFFRGISTPKGIAEIDTIIKDLEQEKKR